MPHPISGRDLGIALFERGLLPENTFHAELHTPVDDLIHLEVKIALTNDELVKVMEAIHEVAAARKRFVDKHTRAMKVHR